MSLQQHVVNISRTITVPQIEVSQTEIQVEHSSLQHIRSELCQISETERQSADKPRILYQCGDCDELFKSLDLWQQHRKEGACQQDASESISEADSHVEPEASSAQSPTAPLNPDEESSFSQTEGGTNLEPEPEHTPEGNHEEQEGSQTLVSQSSDADAAASASNPDDLSPRRRGATKKPKPEPVLLCVDCGSCFGLVSELVAHRKTQHGFEEALHRCSVCGESFLNTTLFLYHRKQHRQKGEEKVVVVPEVTPEEMCVQSNGTDELDAAPSATSLTSMFAQPDLFFCTQCGQSFSDEGGMATHRKDKHGLTEPLHSCCHCGESFMNTTQYLYHWRLHRFNTEYEDGAESGDETTTTKPEDSPQSKKRLLSSPAGESGSPLTRSRPSFRILSASTIKGEWKSFFSKNLLSNGSLTDKPFFFMWSGSKGSGIKEELEGGTTADSDNTNHPPPAKLLQDWARTPLPHVCPYCGKTFTRRVFLRTHVYSHTGEKLFTCKVPVRNFNQSVLVLNPRNDLLSYKDHLCCAAAFLCDDAMPLSRG